MLRSTFLAILCAAATYVALTPAETFAQEGYSPQISRTYNVQDWNRFYHYPYVYYPHNFWSPDYFQSSDNLYHRYPAEMQVPAYNRAYYNYYPQPRKYHSGQHFRLDVL